MPRHTFDNDGTFNNTTNITVAASTTETYLVTNYSGSAVDVTIQIGTARYDSGSATRTTGVVEDLEEGANPMTLDADETVIVTVTSEAGGVFNWRVTSGATVHGLAAQRGTGHTASRTTLEPAVYVGEI